MQKSSLISLFVLVLGLSLAFIFVLPEWNKITILNNEQTAKEKQLADSRSLIANIDELSAKYEKSKSDLEKLSLAIPSEQQLPELLIQFEDMIKGNGMIVNNVEFNDEGASTINEPSPLGDVKIIRTKLAIEGNYSNFKNLLSDMEHNIRLMDMIAINFSQGAEAGSMKFDVSLNTYYLSSNR